MTTTGKEHDSARKTLILATSIPAERERLISLLKESESSYDVYCPETLVDLDRISTDHHISLIITDLDFQNGSLADWLVLWPYPFILLVNNDSRDRLADFISDESSMFLLRREDLSHLDYLPLLTRKVLNTRQSVERQNSFLKASEKQYMNLVQALPDIIYVLDSNGRFTFINNSVRMLGWEPVELIGQHFSVLLYNSDIEKVSSEKVLPSLRGRSTGDDRSPKLFDERRTGTRMTRGLKLKLKRKSTVGGSIDVLITAYGEISSFGYEGFQQEVPGLGTAGIIRKDEIENSRTKGKSTENTIAAGVMTHDQVMHLINNKLQILSSLVSLKKNTCMDIDSCTSLNEVQIQIYTLSLVYQNITSVEGQPRIKMQSYLEDIIKHLMSSFAGNPWMQKIEITSDQIFMEEDKAITISLLTTEILTSVLRIQSGMETVTVPSTITFLRNGEMIQFKIRISEKIMEEYRTLIEREDEDVIVSTLAQILKGELFLDKDSITVFFNAE